MKKRNKIQKLKEKAEVLILCFFGLIILIFGLHYEATEVYHVTADRINGDEVIFIDDAGYTYTMNRRTPIHEGDEAFIKVNTEGTSYRGDNTPIKYGDNKFLNFVW